MFPNLGVRGSRSVCFHDRLILDVSFLTLFFRAISASFFLVTFFLVISPCFFRFFLFKCGLEPRSLVFEIFHRSIFQEFFFKNSFWYDFILFFFRDYFWCDFSQFLVFGCCLPLFCVAIMLFFLVLTVSTFSSFSKKLFCWFSELLIFEVLSYRPFRYFLVDHFGNQG